MGKTQRLSTPTEKEKTQPDVIGRKGDSTFIDTNGEGENSTGESEHNQIING